MAQKEALNDFVNLDFASPNTARIRFAYRTWITFGLLVAAFVPTLFLLSWFCILFGSGILVRLLIDAIAIAIFAVFFVVLEQRPIRIRCRGDCSKIILSNTPWICAHCGHVNSDASRFPFLTKCEKCQVEPKAYECHHCGETIFLTEDPDESNVARNSTVSPETKRKEKHAKNVDVLRAKKEEREEQRAVAKVEQDLAHIQAELKRAKAKPKSAKEVLQSQVDLDMEWEQAKADLKAEYKEKYKNDKATLARMLRALEKRFNDRLAL